MMQRIIVKLLRGETEITTYRFRNPPRQVASIMEVLKTAGYEGWLQDDSGNYFGEDAIQAVESDSYESCMPARHTLVKWG